MRTSFSSVFEKINKSDSFKQFLKRSPGAELCAGFFVIDYQTGNNQQQLDYLLKDGRIFTFIADNEVSLKEAEILEGEKKNLDKIDSENIKVDLDDVEKILESELPVRKIDKRINKIIAILHKHEGREIWNLNCMLQGMEILQARISCLDGEILKFEKKNMFEFVKKQD